MSAERIDKILENTKVSFAMEGLSIDEPLERNIRRILTGELALEDYVAACVQRAQEAAA
jgi:hypothetical protein